MGGPAWVTAVNLVIWTGLLAWLARLDSRLRSLERLESISIERMKEDRQEGAR